MEEQGDRSRKPGGDFYRYLPTSHNSNAGSMSQALEYKLIAISLICNSPGYNNMAFRPGKRAYMLAILKYLIGQYGSNKSIVMKRFLLFLFFGFSIMVCKSQNLDSLIKYRNNDSLNGKVLTYYSHGNRQVAQRLQSLVTSASTYYEKQYGKKLQIKLAVLDSLHWLTELLPYGFVFYDQAWMVMNTGMKYESFKSVYGLSEFASKLDSTFQSNKITPQKVIQDVYAFYCIHEVGHYYFNKISETKAPDKWSNELIATYFYYQYFTNNKPAVLNSMGLFSAIDSKEYQPVHTSILDFNSIYES